MNGPEPLRALSMWQPVASLVAMGVLRTETRTWWVEPQRLVIHAAKSRRGMGWCQLPEYREVMERHGLDPAELPFGAAIGVVDGTSTVSTDLFVPDEDSVDFRLGDFREDRWCLHLRDAWLLPRPVPVLGRQGVWTVPEPAASDIREQLAFKPRTIAEDLARGEEEREARELAAAQLTADAGEDADDPVDIEQLLADIEELQRAQDNDS